MSEENAAEDLAAAQQMADAQHDSVKALARHIADALRLLGERMGVDTEDPADLVPLVQRVLLGAKVLGDTIHQASLDICRITGVEMPEDGDADYALAWERAFEMAEENKRLREQVRRSALPQVTTVAELEALPVGTKMLDHGGEVWSWMGCPRGSASMAPASGGLFYASAALSFGPMTVVWQP